MSYVLEPGEGILQKHDVVWVEGIDDIEESAQVILSNRYLIFLVESEFDEGEYDVLEKIPLRDLRFFQNKPQIIDDGNELELYFANRTIRLKFDMFGVFKYREKRRQIHKDWIASILASLEGTNVGLSNTNFPVDVPSTIGTPSPKNFCMNCGNRVVEGAIFCKFCGTRL